jgi:hypothetical protein
MNAFSVGRRLNRRAELTAHVNEPDILVFIVSKNLHR